MSEHVNRTVTRRDFAKASVAAAAAGLVFVKPKSVYGAPANSRFELGLIGAGGRGTHDAGTFIRSTDTQLVAVADAFQDRLDAAKAHFDKRHEEKDLPPVDSKRLYRGQNAYIELLASKVDGVLITSPPYYHPEHIEAAVDAGIHVYSEKPVATDVYGAKRVMEVGKKAQGKIAIEIGFQLRSSKAYAEAIRRVRKGDIGEFVSGQAWFLAGALGDRSVKGESADQTRLRNWVFDIALSGDIIVEQNVHILDVTNWMFDTHPVKAVGNGGQNVRKGLGDCYDHFEVLFVYPNNVTVAFNSTQYAPAWGGVATRIHGSKGSVECDYGHAIIKGESEWTWEEGSPFDMTEETRIANFINSIHTNRPVNSAEHAAMSALTAILGREAAYKQKEITWKRLLASNQHFRVNLDIA